MSGIFDQATIIRSINTEVPRATLYESRSHTMSAEFGYLTHNYAWLNGSLPPFTTPEYSVLPFETSNIGGLGANETWVGETLLFEADLQCHQIPIISTNATFSISNGKDCSYKFPTNKGMSSGFSFWQEWNTWFMGYGPNQLDDFYRVQGDAYHLASGDCTNEHTFLVLWATGGMSNPSYTPSQWTAAFCEPEYWSQSVKATVQMPAGVIQDVERLGKKTAFDNFNITEFEAFATNGRTSAIKQGPQSLGTLPPEFPYPLYQLYQRFGYFDRSLSNVGILNKRALSNFVVAKKTQATMADLLDPVSLAKAYGDAYKLLFAISVTSELTNHNLSSRVTITRQFQTQAFRANPIWCRLSQGGFGLLALLTTFLLVSTWGRQCNLDGEPNSLAALMQTTARSRAFSGDMDNSEYKNLEDLFAQLIQRKNRYHLRFTPDGSGPQLDVTREAASVVLLPSSESPADHTEIIEGSGRTQPPSKNHWSLNRYIGVVQILAFVSLLGFLAYIYLYGKNHNGMSFLKVIPAILANTYL